MTAVGAISCRFSSPFCVRLLPAREEPAETRDRRRAVERQLRGQRSQHEALVADPLLQQAAHGDGSCLPPSQAGHFPAGMLAAHGCVLEDTLLAKEGSGAEVSNCVLFLEGPLSLKKKSAKKWFGK